jgi:ATP-dependent DNA ligase
MTPIISYRTVQPPVLLTRVAQQFGLEGLVAKKTDSEYESGRRSGTWVKFKITKAQEFVIGGYTLPEGERKYFGSLLVGYQVRRGFCLPAELERLFQKNS